MSEKKKEILVVEDEEGIRQLIAMILSEAGYQVRTINSSDGALKLLANNNKQPDLLILDVLMQGMDGFELCRILREERSLKTPIIFLTCLGDVQDRIKGLALGADDFLPKPFNAEELVARVNAVLRRAQWNLEMNPLTKLPGSTGIQREIMYRLEQKHSIAALYIDIDSFKIYNDVYGFSKGDQVILFLANLLRRIESADHRVDFVGHIGGDDFVVLTKAGAAEVIAQQILEGFSDQCVFLYSDEDRERGWIAGKNRNGEIEKHEFMTVSIGIVEGQNSKISSYGAFAGALSEAKLVAKQRGGNNVFVDRRDHSRNSLPKR